MPFQRTRSAPTLADLLFERAEVGLCLVAPDGNVLRANSEWLRSTGFSLEDVLGADIVALFPETRDMALALHARVRAGYHVEVPRHAQRIDGRDTWWEGSLDPVPMEGGAGVLITAREVTHEERQPIVGDRERRPPDAPFPDREAHLLTILEQTGDAFFLHDFEGRFLDVNRRACERLGYTREELLRMTVPDVEQDFDLAAAQREWAKARPGEAFIVPGHNRRKDGTTFPVEVRFTCLDLHGQRLFFGLNRDVTDRVRAETALRDSEQLYRSLFTLAPSGVVLLDESGQLHAFNDQAHEHLGYTREEFARLRISDLDPDEGPDDVRRHVHQIFAAGSAEFDVRHRAKSGELRNVRARCRVVQMGGERFILTVWQDVTEPKRWERALRESEARLRAAFEATPDAVVISRLRNGAYTALNDGFERLSGWARDEILGRTAPDLGLWVDLEQRKRMIGDLLRDDSVQNVETKLRRKDGGVFTGLVSARTFFADGERFLLAVVRDISDLKRAEAALCEADRRKDEFLAMLSHELRNPLAPICNATYLLEHAEPSGEHAERARGVLRRQSEHLTRLVDDLLDVTRITRGKVVLRRSHIDLRDVVARAAEDLRPVMAERGIAFRTVLPEAAAAHADPTRLNQVITNLLHNASKFTRRGGEVVVSLRRSATEAEIRVRDTGEGIDATVLPRIFDAFMQADQTLARSEGGLGLGLALVKGIVELHGGRVSAESAGIGKGTEFVVRLPLQAGGDDATQQRAPVHAGSGKRRVLIVDDNSDAADSLAEILRMSGHVVDVAYDGPSALAKLGSFRPEVVLSDIGLPGMNGYDVAKAIRANESPDVRLVAVSGYAQTDDVKRAREAGFDAHIAKPPNLEELVRVIG